MTTYLADELEIVFRKHKIKDALIFGSSLWSQVESIIYILRHFSNANIHIFFRDEDINNLRADTLPILDEIPHNAYRMDFGSFFRIKKIKPQLTLILCDNVYNIGYRKAKFFSLICGSPIVLFSNILNEAKYYNFSLLWKDKGRLIKNLLVIALDSIIAPIFYIIFVGIARIIKCKDFGKPRMFFATDEH